MYYKIQAFGESKFGTHLGLQKGIIFVIFTSPGNKKTNSNTFLFSIEGLENLSK
jgi:hypothetical protein